jgi:hypothetical protein
MASRALKLREGKAPVRDRLFVMLFLTALAHGLVILGLTFNSSLGQRGGAPGLEVLLVSDEVPEADRNDSATYLAQRTQLGSGNTRDAVAPRNRASSIPIPKQDGVTDGNSLAPKGDVAGSDEERVLTTTGWSAQVQYVADEGSTGQSNDRCFWISKPPSSPVRRMSRDRLNYAARSGMSSGPRLTPRPPSSRPTSMAGAVRWSTLEPFTIRVRRAAR